MRGAQSILDILMAGQDPDSKVTEADVHRMEALRPNSGGLAKT